jgi:signal transduction histidine kinase
MLSSAHQQQVRFAGQIIALAGIYFLAARIGFLFPFKGGTATIVWPASALALALLTLVGLRYWPAITIGAVFVAISNRHSPALTLFIPVAHTLEPLVGAYLLRRVVHFDSKLEHILDTFKLLCFGALVSSLVGACLAVMAFALSPEGSKVDFSALWWHWVYGHSLSMAVVAPVVFTWHSNPRLRWGRWQLLEAGLVLFMLIFVSLLVFIRGVPSGNLPLGHVIFPFLLWMAIRFSPREVATASLIVSTIAVIGTVNGSGPFSRPSQSLNLFLLATFILAIILTALLIATLLTQRRRAKEALQLSHNELEKKVTERTAELVQTNEQLQHEIDERKRAQVELAEARDQALAALRLKTQILANVSHDARTPLSVIILYVDMLKLLKYGLLTERQVQTLDTIMLSANELLGFINNLLGEAQLSVRRIKPSHSEISLPNWLDEFARTVRPLAERKGLTLNTTVRPGMPAALQTDADWLKQILQNLVGNAIKFTKAGQVEVEFFTPDPEHWGVRVTDTGPGIPKEAQAAIFEAFWQLDGSETREVSRGVGLGLSIVKQLTNLLDGRVTVQSQVGQGSTFTVTVPFVGIPEAAQV